MQIWGLTSGTNGHSRPVQSVPVERVLTILDCLARCGTPLNGIPALVSSPTTTVVVVVVVVRVPPRAPGPAGPLPKNVAARMKCPDSPGLAGHILMQQVYSRGGRRGRGGGRRSSRGQTPPKEY